MMRRTTISAALYALPGQATLTSPKDLFKPSTIPGVTASTTLTSLASTGGPWTPKIQHGGAPAALLTTLAEEYLSVQQMSSEMRRASFLYFRPLPRDEVHIDIRPIRVGAKAAHLELSLYTDEARQKEAVRAVISTFATAEVPHIRPMPAGIVPSPPPLPVVPATQASPFEVPEVATGIRHGPYGRFPLFQTFVGHVAEAPAADTKAQALRANIVAGEIDSNDAHCAEVGRGPLKRWLWSATPIIAGLGALSPSAMSVITADSASGISFYLNAGTHTFMNSDLTVTFLRTPKRAIRSGVTEEGGAIPPSVRSEAAEGNGWVLMDARTRLTPEEGTGVSTAELYDKDGLYAHVSESLVLQEIPANMRRSKM